MILEFILTNRGMFGTHMDEYDIADDTVISGFIELVKRHSPSVVRIFGGEVFLIPEVLTPLVKEIKPYCTRIEVCSERLFFTDETIRTYAKELGVFIKFNNELHNDFRKLQEDNNIEQQKRALKYYHHRFRNEARNYPLTMECMFCQPPLHAESTPRLMILMDGAVSYNKYGECSGLVLELANLTIDEHINMELLDKRVDALNDYLSAYNMIQDNTGFMCREVCERFKVTKKGIYRDNELMKEFANE